MLRLLAVDDDLDMRRRDLLVGSHLLQLRQLLHRRFHDRRPTIKFVYVRICQRVLIFGARQPAADPNSLRDLHEQLGADDRFHLILNALKDGLRAVALIVRPKLAKDMTRVFAGII